MTAVKIEFHRLAEKDYDDAYNWYAERSEETALRFKDAVNEAVLRIVEGPESFPRISGDYRRVRVQRFRYILVFRPLLNSSTSAGRRPKPATARHLLH